jgi:hypothetical protein
MIPEVLVDVLVVEQQPDAARELFPHEFLDALMLVEADSALLAAWAEGKSATKKASTSFGIRVPVIQDSPNVARAVSGWCTAYVSPRRWREFGCERLAGISGGSGTLSPYAMCGRPLL